ncbi:hypothetical protein DICA4_B01486 [Diutina catenulata]
MATASTAPLVVLGAAETWPLWGLVMASVFFNERFSTQPKLLHPTVMTLLVELIPFVPQFHGVPSLFRVKFASYMVASAFAAIAPLCLFSWAMAKDVYVFWWFMVLVIGVVGVGRALLIKGSSAVAMLQDGLPALALGHSLGAFAVSALFVVVLWALEPPFYFRETDASMFWYFASVAGVALAATVYFQRHSSSLAHHQDISEDVEVDTIEEFPISKLNRSVGVMLGAMAGTCLVSGALPYFAYTVFPQDTNMYRRRFTPLALMVWSFGSFGASLLCTRRFPFVLLDSINAIRGFAMARPVFWVVLCFCNIKDAGASLGGDGWYLFVMFLFGFTHGQVFSSAAMMVTELCETVAEKRAAGVYVERVSNVGTVVGVLLSLLVMWYFDANLLQR